MFSKKKKVTLGCYSIVCSQKMFALIMYIIMRGILILIYFYFLGATGCSDCQVKNKKSSGNNMEFFSAATALTRNIFSTASPISRINSKSS